MTPHFFPIFLLPLGIPIDSDIMDGFGCSRCLNDNIEVFNMIRLFAGGATTPWWWKFELNNPGWKMKNSCICDRNFWLFRGKMWLWLFYNLLCVMVIRFYTKNLKSYPAKLKAWQWFSWILILFLIGKINFTALFLLKMTWNFLCRILELLGKKYDIFVNILYNTGGCSPLRSVCHKFYIQLALPISPEIMDGF